jgi:hypothetical protein
MVLLLMLVMCLVHLVIKDADMKRSMFCPLSMRPAAVA